MVGAIFWLEVGQYPIESYVLHAQVTRIYVLLGKTEKNQFWLYRWSYMRAYVLLNLLNEMEKSDKMWGVQSIYRFFLNKFNKFDNTGAGMLDSIYHMTLRLLWNLISDVIKLRFFSLCTQRCY